jgi:hypothetical protein
VIRVDNFTPFMWQLLSVPTIDAQEAQVLVVCACYTQPANGEMAPSQTQRPVPVRDVAFGDPASSSLRYEAEAATEKTRVDILVNGSAYAPGGYPVETLVVELEAGDIRKRVRVAGDRFLRIGGPSAPRAFVTMPLVYERAYGGVDRSHPDPRRHSVFRPNPVGVGYRGARPVSPEILTEYPNLEWLGASIESGPAAFGIVSRGWTPRLEWAGTFDQAWLETQWPLLPRDFDLRHNQSAPLDQQTDSLPAGTPFRLTNFTPEGVWEFSLPVPCLPVSLIFDRHIQQSVPRMDTVLIEPDSRTVVMTFRLKLLLERGRERLREIVLGEVTPGVLRAKYKRKPYLDLRKLGQPTDAGTAT